MQPISLDTETTGLDPYHGSRPFLVTFSNLDMQTWWEWDVDPYTREVQYNVDELEEIRQEIDKADRVVLQNAIFDITMMEMAWAGMLMDEWPWEKTHELYFSSHLLASCQAKDLSTQAVVYLGVNIDPLEKKVNEAVNRARTICRTKAFVEKYGEWALAKEGRPDMPSAGSKNWKADMWVLRALCKHAPDFLPDWEGWESGTPKGKQKTLFKGGDPIEKHPWQTLTSEYANGDSAVTLPIHLKHEDLIKKKGLWRIYEERLKLLPIVFQMQQVGITVNGKRKRHLVKQYTEESEEFKQECIALADDERLEKLPVNGRSKALDYVVFEKFGLESTKRTKTGGPSMDKDVISDWQRVLDPKSKEYNFVDSLVEYRRRQTAISYLDGYERYWIRSKSKGYYTLHPNLNYAGPNTLRWSSDKPNEQNVSSKEGFNLRYCFGPVPGRAWASLDYSNLELRIPAYTSGEEELIKLFEESDKPPYYGKEHILNFTIVFPDEWEEAVEIAGIEGASEYVQTKMKPKYKRTKNGGFAVQYGSVDRGPDKWSTADRAFGYMGAQRRIKQRLTKKERLNQKCIAIARRTGYVHTLPDKEVDPEHGYPVQCSQTHNGRISPTIPLSYFVQSTACWIIMRAMIKVYTYLKEVNKTRKAKDKWYMIIQVHDELVLDFPFQEGMTPETREILENIKSLMESCGDSIGIPLKVGCDIHVDDWSKGTDLENYECQNEQPKNRSRRKSKRKKVRSPATASN